MALSGSDGWTADQVRRAEQPLLAAGEPLMSRAAAGLALVVQEVLASRGRRTGRVLVLAGSGSNGGDALLASAILVRAGCTATVVRLGRRVHGPGLRAAARAGARVLPPDATAGRIAVEASRADVVLDGVLGTGAATSPALRAPGRQVVARVASALRDGPPAVAVDLPSGIGADDGSVHLPVLRAARTATFGGVKAGLLLPPAAALAGRVHLVDIGLGPVLAQEQPAVRRFDSTRPGGGGTLTRRR